MWWIDDIVAPALLLLGISCFVVLVRFRTRMLTHRTNRTVESMYANYADSARKQRKQARQRGLG